MNYQVGLTGSDLNLRKIMTWIVRAVLHSAVVFWLPFGCYALNGPLWDASHGMSDGLDVAGFATFCALIWGMQFKVSMETLSWTYLNHIFLWASIIIFYIFAIGYSNIFSLSPQMYGVAVITLMRPTYWLMLVLVLGTMVAVDFTLELVRLEFFPTPVDIAREIDLGLAEPAAAGGRVRWGDEDGYETFNKPAANTPKPAGGSGAATPSTGSGSFSAPAPGTSVVVSPISGANAGGTGIAPPPAGGPAAAARREGKQSEPRPLASPAQSAGSVPPSPATRPAGAAGSAGLLSPQSFVGAQGTVMLPAAAVLGGLSDAEKARMGVTEANHRSSFDYSGAARDGNSAPLPAPPPPAATRTASSRGLGR
jgi:hypothetical protein